MRVKFVGVICLVVATASWARASEGSEAAKDPNALMSEFSIEPGLAMPTGTTGDYSGNSFSLDASLLHHYHPVVQFGPEIGYIFNSPEKGTWPSNSPQDSHGASFASTLDVRVLHLTPEFKIGPTIPISGVSFNPYVIGGGGFYWTHTTDGSVTFLNGVQQGNTYNFSSSNLYSGGWNVGGGFLFYLPQSVALGFEFRYHHIIHKDTDSATYVIPALKLVLTYY